MDLHLFNTLSRKKEKFRPIRWWRKTVSMYTCGPTVYDYAHIGNFRSYVFADIIKRVLRYNKFRVWQVINITDVGHLTGDEDSGEDKIAKKAAAERKTAWQIAEYYTEAFKSDFIKLNNLEPMVWAKATDHIKAMIDLVKKLEAKGFTYKTSDGVYFDTSKLKDYGKLARLDIAGLEAGKRIEIGEKKKPTDFALWKFSPKDKKRDMEWDSPWGVGFPGWHIECSAMSMKYLGKTIDVHTGGIDHIPVHHSNEIAQSEAATGRQFVRFWLHNNFILMNNEKMAKSVGNITTLKDLHLKGFEPLDYRYLLLNTHYRKELNFSLEAIAAAQSALCKLKRDFLSWGENPGEVLPAWEEKFHQAINDDLSTPQALAIVWDLIKSKEKEANKRETLLRFDSILGLGLENLNPEAIPAAIKKLAEDRLAARKKKDFELADSFRKEIEVLGWEVEDTAGGYEVFKK
ncbi:MAG TPA: cysteine--tRNA ligase [Candidatus Bipolaricaulota bacterium]|nr:cysteine--tRNA ligase [Candidatus Bipolaricaulota bacterium]